jgi:hypothetical protein
MARGYKTPPRRVKGHGWLYTWLFRRHWLSDHRKWEASRASRRASAMLAFPYRRADALVGATRARR